MEAIMVDVVELSSDSEPTSIHDNQPVDLNPCWDLDDDYYDIPGIDYSKDIKQNPKSPAIPIDIEEKVDSDTTIICSDDNLLPDSDCVLVRSEKYSQPVSVNEDSEEFTDKGLGDLVKRSVEANVAVERHKKKIGNSKSLSQQCKKESLEERERKRKEKELLREEKRREMLKEKALKAALTNKLKSMKPEECIKLITVHIDTNIVNSSFGSQICSLLQQSEIKYRVESLARPNTITWTKLSKEHVFNSDEELIEKEILQEEEEIISIMPWNEIIKLVALKELKSWIVRLKRYSSTGKITLLLFEVEKYFNAQKKKLDRELSAAVTGTQSQKKKKVGDEFINVPTVGADELDLALTEIQLLLSVNHRYVESPDEVANFILQFTKSISQKQYKQDKFNREKNSLSWFAKGDNKCCVKVDKNGVGLSSLWQQQICQFNNVGLEVAQAIVGKFRSPQELLTAYKMCQSETEAATLLQDIGVRREAGILSSTRRVGPELSKKIHKFFTAVDPDVII